MDRFAAMRIYSRVARLGSFRAAARELRLSAAAVSRHVARLESHLGARLIQRTTRRLSLTELGERYLERCEQILDDVEALESEIGSAQGEILGRLRVSAGVDLGKAWVAPLLPDFMTRNPRLSVELSLRDEFVDLVAEGVDVAIRSGHLDDSTLVARRLGESATVLVASPDYLARAGSPVDLAGLSEHEALCDTNRRDPIWSFASSDGSGSSVQVHPRVRLAINSPQALRDAALRGLGMASLPHFTVADDLAQGRLIEILPEQTRAGFPLHVVFPARRHLAPKVRAFVAFLVERFRVPSPRSLP
jgi:DNA-binding transcriptional LysR family regulator